MFIREGDCQGAAIELLDIQSLSSRIEFEGPIPNDGIKYFI